MSEPWWVDLSRRMMPCEWTDIHPRAAWCNDKPTSAENLKCAPCETRPAVMAVLEECSRVERARATMAVAGYSRTFEEQREEIGDFASKLAAAEAERDDLREKLTFKANLTAEIVRLTAERDAARKEVERLKEDLADAAKSRQRLHDHYNAQWNHAGRRIKKLEATLTEVVQQASLLGATPIVITARAALDAKGKP